MLHLSVRFLVGREEEEGEKLRFIYRADLSGAAAAACHGAPPICCVTSSSSVSLNISIHSHPGRTYCSTTESIKWKTDEREKYKEQKIVQKFRRKNFKNASIVEIVLEL